MSEIVDALKALVNSTTLLAFLFLILPGTISIRVYDRLRNRQSRKITESIIDVVIASFINDTLWAGLVRLIEADLRAGRFPDRWLGIEMALAVLITPSSLAFAYVKFEDLFTHLGWLSDAQPRPWDKWFETVKREKKQIGVVLVMKSDQRVVGGRYVPPGFASSAPAEESIHIGEVWELDQNGSFLEAIPGSLGMFVQMADVETIEFVKWSSVEDSLEKRKEPTSGN